MLVAIDVCEAGKGPAMNGNIVSYAVALTVYSSLKHGGKGKGLDGALDDLGRRFLRKSGGAAAAAPTAGK